MTFSTSIFIAGNINLQPKVSFYIIKMVTFMVGTVTFVGIATTTYNPFGC